MGLFGAAHGRGDLKAPLLKICGTYPTTHNDKGCHSYTWPKEDLKKYKLRIYETPLNFCWY